MANLRTISAQADAWKTFAAARARFDVERKLNDALGFVAERRARSFAVPTKLVGTKEFQANIAEVLTLRPALAELDVRPDPLAPDELLVSWAGLILGKIQQKHLGWLRPLLATRKLRFFLLDITGGTPEKPTLGVNVAIAGLGDALEAQARGYGWRVRRRYERAEDRPAPEASAEVCDECEGRGEIMDIHDACRGTGCHSCRGTGEAPTVCPACEGAPTMHAA